MTLTYNHLYDLVRRERGQKDLQPVPASFYDDAKTYFDELQSAIVLDPLGSKAESSRVQLVNSRKLLRQLYELREQKILLLSQTRCRTGSVMLDTAQMTAAEHALFEATVALLRRTRDEIHVGSELHPLPAQQEETVAPAAVSVRVLADVPSFVGPQMEPYGPLSSGETVELPAPVAQLLIRKGAVERQ